MSCVPFCPLRSLAVLFALTLRQHVRGRRLLVMSLLFALPGALIALVNLVSHYPPVSEETRFAFIFNVIPCALAPLAAMLYATGIIQDEVEGQTLTYLLLRPLPRWAIYTVRLLATWAMVAALTVAFTAATLLVIAWTGDETHRRGATIVADGKPAVATAGESAISRNINLLPKTAAALALAQAGYCGLFGLLGLLMRRSLFVGVAYIFLFEGLLAGFDTVARQATIMYNFRVLILRWLNPADGQAWSIDLAKAPDARTCVLTLLIAGLVLMLAGAFFFAHREFRLKTPESA